MSEPLMIRCVTGQLLLVSPEDADLIPLAWQYRRRGSPEIIGAMLPEGRSLLTIVTKRMGLRQRMLRKAGDDYRRETLLAANPQGRRHSSHTTM